MNKVRYEDVDIGYLEIDPENQEITIVAPSGNKPRSATIVPFPISRRTRHVDSLRRRAATFPRKGRQWLCNQIAQHRQQLVDLGVDGALVDVEEATLTAILFPPEKREKARA